MPTGAGAGVPDAFLLVSFGGPESAADVMPFLENVTRGRGVPAARLAAVAEHYLHFGGVSPINAQCRRLLSALRAEFAAHDIRPPIYWGNRNWHPLLADTMAEMAADGVCRALAFVTSAYSSYSGCRQYREDLAAARERVGAAAPVVDKIRQYFNHPGFVAAAVDSALGALAQLPEALRADAALVFTTHSIPAAMAETSGPCGGAYVAQHLEVARLVADGVAGATGRAHRWRLVYQSRSGSGETPWLEPDVSEHLRELSAQGTGAVVVSPIGFLSDHLEVCYDLDVTARDVAGELGLDFVRAATVGTAPAFVAAIRELVVERLDPAAARPALGNLPARPDRCAPGCCPNPAGYRPAVAGSD